MKFIILLRMILFCFHLISCITPMVIKDMPFKRIVLYFSPDLIANDTICQLLSEKELLFVNETYTPNQILSLLLSLTHEIDVPGKYHDAYICNQLNGLLLNMLRLDFEASQKHTQKPVLQKP